jgi:uncharacterized protein YdhG (YjbR/CyaY superfamily)
MTMSEKKSNNKNEACFSDFEKTAMKERAKELKQAKDKEAAEQAVLDKIAELSTEDQIIAMPLHKMVKKEFPELGIKTWYGMPAYTKEGKVLVFFQGSTKFDSRYCTLGFSDLAKLDSGSLWPSSYAITAWNSETEEEVRHLIKRAIGD